RAIGPLEGDDAERLPLLDDLAETMLSAGETLEAEWVTEELSLRADDLRDERHAARARVLGGQLTNRAGGSVRQTLAVVGPARARPLPGRRAHPAHAPRQPPRRSGRAALPGAAGGHARARPRGARDPRRLPRGPRRAGAGARAARDGRVRRDGRPAGRPAAR